MDTCTQPSDWCYVSQPDTDFMDFDQYPTLECVDAAPSQLLTPPSSAVSPPSSPLLPHAQDSFTACAPDTPSAASDDDSTVSVSTTFFPGAIIHTLPPDILLLSSDYVFFYVHSTVLLGHSSNAFSGLIPHSSIQSHDNSSVVSVTEHSVVVNIILHTFYGISCSHYTPTFESLSSAVVALPKYGLTVKDVVVPTTPLYTLLLSHAPLHPLDVYTLAAKYDAYDLAVPTSSHLLSFSLPSMSDDMAAEMGPKYLKRLFFLHLGRLDALKRLLLPPPHPHAPMEQCSFDDQKRLTRAWALASAYLAWDSRPDMSTNAIQSALAPLEEQLSCNLCREALRKQLNNVVVQWSVIKRTI